MGREIRRVPVDFDWPIGEIWPGFCYTTPDCRIETCPDSKGSAIEWTKEAMCAFHQALWNAERYPRLDPPTGEGWQLWETVTEGSPISPVFAERDGLVDWLTSPDYRWGASTAMTREQASRFIDAGWAPSFVAIPGVGFMSGEKFVGGAS